jgi:plasmid maintenance system antidote protein VapI
MKTFWNKVAVCEHGLQCKTCCHVWHGTSHPRARLTEANVLDIRCQYANGVPTRNIAEQYSIPRSRVSSIATGKSWKHLPGAVENIRKPFVPNRLSKADALKIRAMREAGSTYKEIAKALGVSTSTIADIVTGRTWAGI